MCSCHQRKSRHMAHSQVAELTRRTLWKKWRMCQIWRLQTTSYLMQRSKVSSFMKFSDVTYYRMNRTDTT